MSRKLGQLTFKSLNTVILSFKLNNITKSTTYKFLCNALKGQKANASCGLSNTTN